MSAKTKKPSAVVSLIQSVWDNANSGKGHSWQILNGSLCQALRLAVTSHYKFETSDFGELYRRFDGGYWFGPDSDGNGYGTHFYSEAVTCGNMSACQSFEAWKGMEPYLFLGKRLAVGGGYGCKETGLLVIDPNWKNVKPGSITRYKTDEKLLEVLSSSYRNRWWVTGFDNNTLRLASYFSATNQGGHRTGKPVKLKKITREELAEMSKVLRAGMRPVKPKKGKESK